LELGLRASDQHSISTVTAGAEEEEPCGFSHFGVVISAREDLGGCGYLYSLDYWLES
jgi:hypothetical protein